ncbi:MAG: adenylosuccinate synthetase, partial [Lysobacterales bacterium]
LEVLDGLNVLKICTRYRLDGKDLESTPIDADSWDALEPVYASFPGWKESSRGATTVQQLPANARRYLDAVEELTGAPIHLISTGPDRAENIILQYPFGQVEHCAPPE